MPDARLRDVWTSTWPDYRDRTVINIIHESFDEEIYGHISPSSLIQKESDEVRTCKMLCRCVGK
jgi:hypothetical protein